MNNILELTDYQLKIKNNVLVEKLNFSLSNEIVGIVGNNGCGKTTLAKELCGLVSSNLVKEKSVYAMIENPAFYDSLSGFENIEYFVCDLDREYFNKLLIKFDLKQDINKKVKNYSLGMKAKLNIIMVFLKKTKVLIFDEPTNGLDDNAIDAFYEEVAFYREEYKAGIIIISHKKNELVNICDRIFAISNKKFIETKDYKYAKLTFLNKVTRNVNSNVIAVSNNNAVVRYETLKELAKIIKEMESNDLLFSERILWEEGVEID